MEKDSSFFDKTRNNGDKRADGNFFSEQNNNDKPTAGNIPQPAAKPTAGNSAQTEAKPTAGNSARTEAKPTAGNSTKIEDETAPADSTQAGDKTASSDSAQAEDKTADGDGAAAVDATVAEDGAKAGDASTATEEEAATEEETATEEEAVAVDADSANEAEAAQTSAPIEVINTPKPDPVPSASGGSLWIAIIAGLAVLIAVVLLLKHFVLDRRAGNSGNGSRGPQSPDGAENVNRGKHIAKAQRPIGSVSATMAAEDSQAQSQYSVGCAQWIGKREDQEDALMVSEWRNANAVASRGILAAVADGIGGLDDGQIASQTLMRSFEDGFEQLESELSPQGKLLELTAQGQRKVLDINRRGRRCGTTLVAVLIQDGYLSTISVGDSRIVLYRSGILLQLNREHVNARVRDEETAFGGATPVEGRRRAALTSYIGKEDLRELDRTLNPTRLISGDRVLLMSDGVFGILSDDQLVAVLEQDAQKAADSIISQVQKQKNQYQDNATVVVIEVK